MSLFDKTIYDILAKKTPYSHPHYDPKSLKSRDTSVYGRLLWTTGHGYPLFRPDNVPPQYTRSGFRIGDVGIITTDGYFDFLFNVFVPAEDPINCNGVPEGFQPLKPFKLDDIITDKQYAPGSFVVSKSMKAMKGSRKIPPFGVEGDYYFQSSEYEGALLILPEGSFRDDLQNIEGVREYAVRNSEAWYRYAAQLRDAINGSIHLVTGTDKSTFWALHCYSDRQPTPARPVEIYMRCDTRENWTRGTESGHIYGWAQGGPGRYEYGPSTPTTKPNQCLFLRTFCVALNNLIWEKACTIEKSYLGGGGWSLGCLSVGGTRSRPIEFTGLSKTLHPSRFLAEYLLQKVPTASAAIIHHNDWQLLTKEGEDELPMVKELKRRVEQFYSIEFVQNSKGVFLKQKDSLSRAQMTAEKLSQGSSPCKKHDRCNEPLDVHPNARGDDQAV